MHYGFRGTFLRFLKIPQWKEGDLISWGEPFLQRGWITWSPLLYFDFKDFKDANSASLIRFWWNLNDSMTPFSEFSNFYKLKRLDLISLGKAILQNGWIIWSSLFYFNFKSFKNPSYSSLIRSQWILHDWIVTFSELWHFYKLKRGNVISWREVLSNL